MNSVLIVGAGFSGAVIARELADKLGIQSLVIDTRSHVAGNCHTCRGEHGILEHVYGPHIFNTNHTDVVDYLSRWTKWKSYSNRVKAVNRQGVFSFPINLHTINQFFGKKFSPSEAEAFIRNLSHQSIATPKNFEEQALKSFGQELYEAFFEGYTRKHWGVDPKEIPASVFKRVPLRFTYDDNYYQTRFQLIPIDGYTSVVERILSHRLIKVMLNTPYSSEMSKEFLHTFYSGPIDAFFGHQLGRLSYRTVYFEKFLGKGDLLGNAVLNYTDESTPYTREHEHKHFTPWESHERTVVYREFSKDPVDGDVPYYPMRLARDLELLKRYQCLAEATQNMTFMGRLGTYRYLDMDQVIGGALDTASLWMLSHANRQQTPVFGNFRLK